MAERSIVWVKEVGVEYAEIVMDGDTITATGVAIGTRPLVYRLDYTLECGPSFVTSRLSLGASGDGWWRRLDLVREPGGEWTASGHSNGDVGLPEAGGDVTQFASALDCDLAWSPLTNTMPVLRHGLLDGGGPVDFLMAWVSVPDLHVHPSRQRYTFIRRDGPHSIVRYESGSRDFVADLTFDADGMVLDYPGIGRAST